MICSTHILKQIFEDLSNHFGKPLYVNKDFIALDKSIMLATNSAISTSTLKRMWRILKSGEETTINLHDSTLDILATYLGYPNFTAYLNHYQEDPSKTSHNITSRKLLATQIEDGQLISLTWNPGREVVVKHEEGNRFSVVSSINSKLQQGDTFELNQIVERCPLVILNLKREGFEPVEYVCGQDCSLDFKLL